MDMGSNNIGSGQTYAVGEIDVVTGFDPATDMLDLGGDSIHNQIGVDTADGFAMLHMFDGSKSLLLEGVFFEDLVAANFAPIADSHLQQDLSAALAWENGSGLVRENTVYVRSHEAGLQEVVDFNPATDKISMFYLSVRGDQQLNFSVEDTAEGVRFFSPITGQSITLRDTALSDLNSTHFEWRANQIEDNVAGRMGLADQIDSFSYQNIYSGKSVPMAGLVDRAPYHDQPDYTGTPIGTPADGGDTGGGDTGGDTGGDNGGDTDGNAGGDTGGGDAGGDTGGDMGGDGGATDTIGFSPTVTSQWDAGFVVETTYTPEQAVNGWTVQMRIPGDIVNIWNADIVSQEGDVYTLAPKDYNADVAAGQTIGFGFQVTGSDTTIEVIGQDNTGGDTGGMDMGGGDTDSAPVNVTVTGGSVTEADPGMDHMHGDGTTHVHDDGHRYILFEVSLDAPATSELTLTYATADGTAVADTTNSTAWDYHETIGTLVFAPGEQTKTVPVAIHPDMIVEDAETFTFAVTGENITGMLTATGTINDNDVADPTDGGMDQGGDMDMGGGDGAAAGAFTPTVTSQWNDGFVVETTFTPDAAVSDWTVQLRIPGDIVNIWNADVVAQEGDVYTLAPKDYNADVAAGQTIDFGFQVSGSDTTIEVIGQDNTGGDMGGDGGMDTGGGDTGGDTGGGDTGGDTGGDPDTGGGDTGGGNTAGGGDILNGPLSTAGTDIVDADGVKVDLKGVNWFGFETDISVAHGLWARNMEDMLDEIADFGFNMIRLPFAGQLAVNDAIPGGINTGENPALAGMTSLEVMGEFLDAAAERGLGVLLDMHRTTPGDGPERGGRIPDVQNFLDQWAAMADQFGDHPAVIGFDLYNEPHGYSWEEWAPIAEQVGNMLLQSHPDELIIVEGVETYQGESHWWGGNLQGVADRPVVLNADDKLVYSPHEYATSVFEQPYFTEAGYDPETTLPEVFRENWGFIEEQGIAPLLLGEFGSTFENQTDKDWAPVLADYLIENDIDWSIWSWNPNSGDTGGVVQDDWQTPREDAFTYLLDTLLGEQPDSSVSDAIMSDVMPDNPDMMMDVVTTPQETMDF